jgi:hypothetical protein
MYDFKKSVSLSRLFEFSNDHSQKLKKIADPYFYDLYFRILQYATQKGLYDELADIQNEYYNGALIFALSDFEDKKYEYEREISESLRLGPDLKLNSKKDQFAVIKCLKDEYKRYLKVELSKYRKEDLLVSIYSIASLMSYISSMTAHLFKYKFEDIDSSKKFLEMPNLIVDSLGVLYESEKLWVNGTLGTVKKTCEYLINFLLNEDIEYSSTMTTDIDLKKVFMYGECIVDKLVTLKSIDSLNRMNSDIEMRNGHICLSENLLEKISIYTNISIDDSLDIDSENARELLQDFEDVEGYSSRTIEKYVMDFKTKNLIIEASINVVEDKFIYTDMVLTTGFGYDSLNSVLNTLSLNACEDVDSSIFSKDNRLFRTPIIKVDNHFILTNQLLMESSHYLRYRILKNELTKDKKFAKKIIKKYNEVDLKELQVLIDKYAITGGVNFQIDDIPEISEKINKKGISRELDFYFIHDKTLYTMEFKNQDIDSGLHEICKTYRKNIENKTKHLKLIEILKGSVPILEKEFNKEINEIRSFLVFKRKNSFSEFYEGNDIYCCSFSLFYEFCEALFKYGDFENLCDGFIYLK